MLRLASLLMVFLFAGCDTADDDGAAGGTASAAPRLEASPKSSAVEARAELADSKLVVQVASGGNVSASDAAAIASVMRSGLARCSAPGRDGARVELNVEAEPSGKIRSASASSEAELPAYFKDCLERHARVAYFPATDQGARVKLRVEFELPASPAP